MSGFRTFDLEGFELQPNNPGAWNVDGLNRMFALAFASGGGAGSLMRAGTYKVDSASLVVQSGVVILVGPNVVFVDSTTGALIPALQAVIFKFVAPSEKGYVYATDYGFVAGDARLVNRTNSYLALMAATPGGGRQIYPNGQALVKTGVVSNKSFLMEAPDHMSGVFFVPTLSNDTLIKWVRTGASFPSTNEEGNLDGCGQMHFGIFSDMSVRANGVWFVNCDHTVMDDVFAEFLDGFHVNGDRSREAMQWTGHNRYCGHYDDTDTPNCVPATQLVSATPGGDTTNLAPITLIAAIYPWWDGLLVDSSTDMMLGNVFVHGQIEGSTNVENVVIQQLGGSGGFTAFVPNNKYAALHTSINGSETSVAGLKWKPLVKRRTDTRLVNSRGNIVYWKAPGCNSLITNRVDDSSLWTVSGGALDGAETSTNFTVGSTTFTVSGNVLTTGAPHGFFTGDPVNVISNGTLPKPLSNPNKNNNFNGRVVTLYAILLSPTTLSLANTYKNSMAGTAITLLDTGTGTHSIQYLGAGNGNSPAVLGVIGGSAVVADGRLNIATGRNMLLLDDLASFEQPFSTTSSNANDVSRSTPNTVCIGVIRGAQMQVVTPIGTGTTHNGTTTIDGMSASLTALLSNGMAVSGTGVGVGATISSVGGTSIVVSVPSTADGTVTLTFNVTGTGTTHSGNNLIDGLSTGLTSSIWVGMGVTGTGVGTGAYILSVSSTSITVSQNSTANGTVTLLFHNSQPFRMLQGGHRFAITDCFGKNPVGSANGGTPPIGGINTGPSRTGSAVVDATFSWVNVVSHTWMKATLSSAVTTDPRPIYAANTQLWLDLSQANLTALFEDIYVMGFYADGLS